MKMLAFDLGASAGKIFLGSFDGNSLNLNVVKRFDNNQIFVRDEIFWDVLNIFNCIKDGITYGLQKENKIISIGLDSFSNDFGLLDKDGRFISQVHCYRDRRTKRTEEKIYSMISKETLHSLCGNQNALFGTLMQLASMCVEKQFFLLKGAGSLLLLPDLLIYFLTGEIYSEYTISSVSQMMDLYKGTWSPEILEIFGIPINIMPSIVQPGTRIGKITGNSDCLVNGGEIEVVSVCEHDTASAFLAAPQGGDSIIISSGTWSLVGVETKAPIINDYTFHHNIANEGGFPGHHRLLKNVMGLWLIQECRRHYIQQGMEFSFEDLIRIALLEEPFKHMINPNDERFFSPGDMPEKISNFCVENRQERLESPGEIIRCVVESLALQYRLVIEELETVVNRKFSQINIVGGGSNNGFLDQCVANATGKSVYAGPIEATAIGNLVVQLFSFGEIGSAAQGRQLVRNSFSMDLYEPENIPEWEARYQEYSQMINFKK
jgi:sugar (pentulose or hexulose) kinase